MARRRSISWLRHGVYPRPSGARCCARDQRLFAAANFTTAQTFESFDQPLRDRRQAPWPRGSGDKSLDPLLAACRTVAEACRAPFIAAPRPLGSAGIS